MLFTGGVSLRTALRKETSRSTLIKFWRHVTQRGEEAVRTDIHLEEEVLKKRQKYHRTFVHKIHGRKDFIFYCSHPKINQEFNVKGHGSKKRTNFLLLKTGLTKENGCTDTPWLMHYLHPVRYWTLRIAQDGINPLNAELNPICYLLALLAHHFLHVSRIRVKSLTLRLLVSYIYMYIYIYGAPILDVSRSHTTTQHSR